MQGVMTTGTVKGEAVRRERDLRKEGKHTDDGAVARENR
jgi:hypothetical protein